MGILYAIDFQFVDVCWFFFDICSNKMCIFDLIYTGTFRPNFPWSLRCPYERACTVQQKINDNQTSFVNQNNNLWVKKETWTNISSEFLTSAGSPNTERVRLQRNVMDWEQLLHFEWQANARVSGEAAKGGGNEELSLSFPAPNSLSFRLVSLATRAWLLAESLLTSCYGFIFVRDGCIVIIMAHSIVARVPIPLKGFFKCWHLLWLSTSEQVRTKLHKLSSLAKLVNSNHFCEI